MVMTIMVMTMVMMIMMRASFFIRRRVSAWSLVHLAEKRRNRQKSALCIVTHGPAAGALLSLSPALTKGNIPVALKNARSYSFSGADFLTSGERLLRKF